MPDPIETALLNLILLQRISNGIGADANALIDELFDEIVARLARIDPTSPGADRFRRQRLEKLLREVATLSRDRFGDIHREARESLARLGRQQGQAAEDLLRAPRLESAIVPGHITVNRMKAILDRDPIQGDLLRNWFRRESAATVSRLTRQLRIGMAQAETVDQLITRVRGRRVGRQLVGGVLQITKRDAAAIVRTAVTDVSNTAAFETYRENADVTAEYEYIATLDGRTTEICIALDGRRFRYDDPKAKRPPQHVGCRSGIVPVVKGVEVPRETFEAWFRRQAPSKQVEILGRRRAELFRAGKLDLRDLIRGDNSIVRLEELEAAA